MKLTIESASLIRPRHKQEFPIDSASVHDGELVIYAPNVMLEAISSFTQKLNANAVLDHDECGQLLFLAIQREGSNRLHYSIDA